jgi:outer membrane lipoprotein-sorting protein
MKINKVKLHFWGVTLLLSSVYAGPLQAESAPPKAAVLLSSILDNPSRPYQGQMLISYWSEKGSKAEEVKVYFSPPNNYRFEFLSPNGAVDRVVISNGTSEQVQFMNHDKVQASYSTDKVPSIINTKDEKQLLVENYKIVLKPSEKIVDRNTWSLELTPLTEGKPHQIMRIDRETHVILEIKRYTADGKNGSLTRFTKFSPMASLPGGLFLSASSLTPLEKEKVGTTIPVPDQMGSGSHAFLLPTKLYGGFLLEADNQIEVNGKSIKHLRYTDGLLPVSIFQAPLPVKAPEQNARVIPWNQPLEMGATTGGNVYQWKKDEVYYILIGDLQQDLLQKIAGHIQ